MVQVVKPAAPAVGEGEARIVAPVNPAEPSYAANTVAPSAPAGDGGVSLKALPAGFRVRPGSKVHPSGWPLEIVGDRDGAPMVLVPGATFTMGATTPSPPKARPTRRRSAPSTSTSTR